MIRKLDPDLRMTRKTAKRTEAAEAAAADRSSAGYDLRGRRVDTGMLDSIFKWLFQRLSADRAGRVLRIGNECVQRLQQMIFSRVVNLTDSEVEESLEIVAYLD